MKLKPGYFKFIRWSLLGILIIVTILFRWFPSWSEWYARVCYPYVSGGLSIFSSIFPFSVGDCFIVLGCAGIVAGFIYALCRRRKGLRTLLLTVEFCGWVYVWFYLVWGVNYFRIPFYERAGIERVSYSPDTFRGFLGDYVKGLNESYTHAGDSLADWYMTPFHRSGLMDSLAVEKIVGNGYRNIASRFGIVATEKNLRAKPMLWSGGMSKVGVTGYMGPFFSEFNINSELLAVEYPFTYAHELAHRLGIAGEAEANLYAYIVCSGAESPEIRFSGYMSLFAYVMNNARRLLTEDEYAVLYKSITPGIIELYKTHLDYWRGKYSQGIGNIQNKIYNFYLKSNQVGSGTKNYSEVVGLLVALRESEK